MDNKYGSPLTRDGALGYKQDIKPMSAVMLITCLAGDLGVEANLVFDTIKESEDLRRVVKSYGAGDFTYLDVLDTVKDFF